MRYTGIGRIAGVGGGNIWLPERHAIASVKNANQIQNNSFERRFPKDTRTENSIRLAGQLSGDRPKRIGPLNCLISLSRRAWDEPDPQRTADLALSRDGRWPMDASRPSESRARCPNFRS